MKIEYIHSTARQNSLIHEGNDNEGIRLWRRIIMEALPYLGQFGTNKKYIQDCGLVQLQKAVFELLGQTEIARMKQPWKWADIMAKGPGHILFQGWGLDPREDTWDTQTQTRGLWHKSSGLILARTNNSEPQLITSAYIPEHNLYAGIWQKKNLCWT
jgi:hypothetical protein